VSLCGIYEYESGDRIKFDDKESITDNSLLVVRDEKSTKYFQYSKIGKEIRVHARLINPCTDLGGNNAAFLQGGGTVLLFLRPLQESEPCERSNPLRK
jgi:hypothetical protein